MNFRFYSLDHHSERSIDNEINEICSFVLFLIIQLFFFVEVIYVSQRDAPDENIYTWGEQD